MYDLIKEAIVDGFVEFKEIEEKKNLTENFIRGMEFVRNVKSSNDDISEI